MRGATGRLLPDFQQRGFQSTLPMRGATTRREHNSGNAVISIHAPHAGSDLLKRAQPAVFRDFNPRSPCGERLPLCLVSRWPCYFNPRSPCGERHDKTAPPAAATLISIHAPHAGSDLALTRALHKERTISIHAPHAGSDEYFKTAQDRLTISIHAPHAGSDDSAISRATELNNFNPRSPCGERRGILLWGWLPPEFQSTLPMRGATGCKTRTAWSYPISIHAPHAGSDLFEGYMRRVDRISIHAPHAGSDAFSFRQYAGSK